MKCGITVCTFAILSVLLTGCWNRQELNDLAVVMALGIDKSEGQFDVYAQVVDPSEVAVRKGSATGRAPVTVYHAKGASIAEALRRMTTVSPRKLFLSHMRMLIISEDLAKSGIADILDFLSRDRETRMDFFIAVAKDAKARDVLTILTAIEKIPAEKMYSMLEASETNWAPTLRVRPDQLIFDLTQEGRSPVLSGITIAGNKEIGSTKQNVEEIDSPARLQYVGLGVFRGEKLVGWLNETESKGINYIRGKVKKTIGLLPCPDDKKGTVSIEGIRHDASVTGKVVKGKPKIDIMIKTQGNVSEVDCAIDMSSETIEQLENEGEKRIQSIVEAAINKALKQYKADIFGFGDAIHQADPEGWKKLKPNWQQEIVDLQVNVTVVAKIRRIGSTADPIEKHIHL